MKTSFLRPLLAWNFLVPWLPWLVLAVSLAMTFQLHRHEQNYARQKLQTEYSFRVSDTVSRIEQRMGAYLQVMRGAQGFFNQSRHVERKEFRAYMADLQLQENYPGIQGLAFTQIVAPAEKARHIAAIRKEGFPDYTISPATQDGINAPIVYIEPFAGRNLRVVGFNMYSEPVRRAALEQARDSGRATLSGKVQLRADVRGAITTGFLAFLPVYQYGAPHDTLAERRASIKGWVQAPFIVDDLMPGIFGEHAADLDVEIHDGTTISPQTLLYDSDGSQTNSNPANEEPHDPLFNSTQPLNIAGRIWTLKVHSLPALEARLDTQVPRFVVMAGVTVSLLLALLTWLLVNGREHALQAAREMNQDLIESEQKTRDAHARLQESEELNRFALEGAGMGVWNWNITSDEINFSARYQELMPCVADKTGRAMEQLTQCVAPEDVARMVAELQAYLDGKTPTYFSEYRVLAKAGQVKWMLNRGMLVSRTADGRPQRMIGTIVDVSARKQTEQALRHAQQDSEQALAELASYLQAIGQHALISVTDLSGRIIEVNDRFCEISGYSRPELIGQNHNIVNSKVHPGTFFAELWRTITRGDLWRNEICNRTKSGALYWVDSAIVPVKDVHGQISRYISVRLDITERKKTEAELMRAMVAVAVADDANAAKSAFLANMSHEIRTPMNSIIGMTHLILKTGLDPRQRDYIAKIQNSSQHLLGIISNILDFSKIEADKLVLESLDFELATVVRDLSSQLGDSAAAKGLELVFDIDPQLWRPLHGDPLRLRQILLNYIGNAIKFTHQGKIIVRARLLEEAGRDHLVRFEVQDTGIGMDKAEMANLFQAFQQADASTTRNYGGTGLGLAISKQLVELMGGEVGVQSQPGHGSTFWFMARLGRGTERTASAQKSLPIDLELIKGATLLLVEDNLFNQQVARELLEQVGAVITIANNGQEALDCLLQKRFDCVLMDIQMPVMDGLEATRQIRANPALSSTRVIGLTANAGKEDQTRCFEAGMNDFVSKPIDIGRLLAVLAASLAQQPGQNVPARTASAALDLHRSAAATKETAAGIAPDIDLDVLAQTVSDNPEKIRKFALMFVSSMHDTLAELESALARVDMMGVAALGHRAKSSARTVGATGFANLLQALEQCKRAGDYDKACSIVAQMRPLLARINLQIDAEINI